MLAAPPPVLAVAGDAVLATGLAAGATKFGGIAIIALVVLAIAPPSIATTALLGAVPMGLGAVAVIVYGIEPKRRTCCARVILSAAKDLLLRRQSEAAGP